MKPNSVSKAIAGKGVTGMVNGQSIYLCSPSTAQDMAAFTAEQMAQIEAFNDDGKTVSILMVDQQIAGLLAIRDEPRADAFEGLKALADASITTLMLTGDNQRTAQAIGKRMGITEIHAQMMPEDKQRIVTVKIDF